MNNRDVTVSLKAELLKNEAIIADGLEEFVRTGIALYNIRAGKLYREAGYATWEDYTRKRWGYSTTYANDLISSAEVRMRIPDLPKTTAISGHSGWNETQVRELKKLDTPGDQRRVAKKIVAEVGRDPDFKVTATTVRKFVDDDKGVKRGGPAKEPELPELDQWLRSMEAKLRTYTEGLNSLTLADIRRYARECSLQAESLAEVIGAFEGAAQRVWHELPDSVSK